MDNNLYIKAAELLTSGQKLVMARIIKRTGSTPRDVGSACIITEQNALIGTIGGGVLEFKVQKKAVELMDTGRSYIFEFKLSGSDLANEGMICGGNVDVFLEPLFPENSQTQSQFKTIRTLIDDNKSCILSTRIENDLHAMSEDTRLVMTPDGGTIGNLENFRATANYFETAFECLQIDALDKKSKFFIEKITGNPHIFLFGGGHVSKFVVRLAKMVDFDITVIDDRQEFANAERFPDADRISCITDFETAFEGLSVSSNAYILIITRGHLHDKIVLEQAVKTNAAYIGMIGSKKKRDTIYKALTDNGVSKEKLAAVYSPIGLEIGAQTPEEIAVSIVGQLIEKRAAAQKKLKRIA